MSYERVCWSAAGHCVESIFSVRRKGRKTVYLLGGYLDLRPRDEWAQPWKCHLDAVDRDTLPSLTLRLDYWILVGTNQP